ncbi:uncharacterized protein LOC100680275 [Nasonia vitripennis]|uniref:Death domain-containing protein n=1 Tax=Nasonia vitripennis TaxID=7425 RepID=A0A7M7GE36_NASVI|nr:uncharacterized protein LOC100680275 [Nasonia vitripennis]
MYARKLNPELEKLQEEVLGPPSLETFVRNVQEAASKIHSSFLFENEGKELLQKLCLFLSATASGKSYGDWQKFAAVLGLMIEQIKCIDYDFKGLQDPTYYVLLAFSQLAEATMDKIIIALQKIDRPDVINRVTDCFNYFIQDIVQNRSLNLKDGIYKSSTSPRAPLVLCPVIQKHHEINQSLAKVPYKPNITCQSASLKYGSIVMLTFADDGRRTAEEIARIFRSKNPKIGVIILQEQEKHVYSKAEEFIEDCFKQVNYIVPILTMGYLNKINNYVEGENDNTDLDSKYLRYIYSLLRYEYVKQDCINNRVRCIIPDMEVKTILSLDLHPTLQAWFRESDIHSFTEKILLQKF